MSLYWFSCHAKISVHHVSVGLHILIYCPFSCKTLFIFLTRSFLSFRPVELEKILSFHPTCVWHQQLLLALEIAWPGLVILLKFICLKWLYDRLSGGFATVYFESEAQVVIPSVSTSREMIRGRPAEWKQNHRMEKQSEKQIYKSCLTKQCHSRFNLGDFKL